MRRRYFTLLEARLGGLMLNPLLLDAQLVSPLPPALIGRSCRLWHAWQTQGEGR